MIAFSRGRIFFDHDPRRTAARIGVLVRGTLRIEVLVRVGFRVRVGVLVRLGSGVRVRMGELGGNAIRRLQISAGKKDGRPSTSTTSKKSGRV